MEIILRGMIEDVETYMGKNGFGARVTISNVVNKRRKNLAFITKDRSQADLLESHLQEEVEVKIVLEEDRYKNALRFGDVLSVESVK